MIIDRPEQVRAAFDAVRTVSVLLDMHDWDALLRELDRTEAVGPILDPTDYMKNSGTYRQNARIVRATRDYLAALRREQQASRG